MLDIRTLLLGTPEDRYAPTPAQRAAERRLYRLLSGVREGVRPAPAGGEARMEERMA